jgi:hypothetical protein
MGMLNKKEKEELLHMADSASLKSDMRYISANRFNPLMHEGNVDMDRLITLLSEYNAFINHTPKPFKPIKDTVMKL